MDILKGHPIAELWPMMEPSALTSLSEHINQHGLIDEIVLYEGAILDGRNRYKACVQVGVSPRTRQFGGREGDGSSAVAFVVGKNQEHRSALTGGDEVKLYRGLKPFEEEEARKRQGTRTDISGDTTTHVRSSDLAAKGAGIGVKKAAQIDYVESHAPDLIPALEAGEISVNKSYTQAKERTPPMTEVVVEDFIPTPEFTAMIERNTAIVAEAEQEFMSFFTPWREKYGKSLRDIASGRPLWDVMQCIEKAARLHPMFSEIR